MGVKGEGKERESREERGREFGGHRECVEKKEEREAKKEEEEKGKAEGEVEIDATRRGEEPYAREKR